MTTTKTLTYRDVLNRANPNDIADALRAVKIGNMLSKIKVTVAALTATATPDITSQDVLDAATVTGIELAGETLPAIGKVVALRCTTSGTANTVGSYAVTDASGTVLSPTASTVVGLAKLSDDGTTLTFPTTVTGFVLEYYPAAAVDLDDQFENGI